MYVCLCVCGREHAALCQERCKSCVGQNVKILSCVSSANECLSSRRVWIFNWVSAFVCCVCGVCGVCGSARAVRTLRFSLCLIEFSHRERSALLHGSRNEQGHTLLACFQSTQSSAYTTLHITTARPQLVQHTHMIGPQSIYQALSSCEHTLCLGTVTL